MEQKTSAKRDFSQGGIAQNIFRLAIPLILAEFVHVLYNIVDRIYIGRMSGTGTAALTGVGVAVPLVSLTAAFANLCSTGGSPLCAIARGQKDTEKAAAIQETAFTLLLIFSAVLTVALYAFRSPLLTLLGADEETLPFALEYYSVYVLGTVFTMISLGMNSFINMQGFPGIGMGTVIIGAAVNIVLDPIFMFTLGMGVRGAAVATVISQALSAAWVLVFLCGKRSVLRIRRLRIEKQYLSGIFALGATGFCFKVTNSLTQAVVNMTLRSFGGALSMLYIGSMSVINSLREVLLLSVSGFSSAAQPFLGYNYGAGLYKRVRDSIRFLTIAVLIINTTLYSVVMLCPRFLAGLFTTDEALLELCARCIRLYFMFYFGMGLQHVGQSVFVALNRPRFALFFSLLRKVILVVPLTLILPRVGFGADGVFYAEAFSEILGGCACFITMRLTVARELKRKEEGLEAV